MSMVPMQCWFPVGKAAPSWRARTAVLWTSGLPSDQLEEAGLLLEVVAKMAGVPGWVFSHLALGSTNSVHYDRPVILGLRGIDM